MHSKINFPSVPSVRVASGPDSGRVRSFFYLPSPEFLAVAANGGLSTRVTQTSEVSCLWTNKESKHRQRNYNTAVVVSS